MIDAPERIWLQLGAGDNGSHTWCDQNQGWDDGGPNEPEYVRADIHDAVVAERDAMRAALQQVLDHCRNTGRGSEVIDSRIVERCEDTAVDALTCP